MELRPPDPKASSPPLHSLLHWIRAALSITESPLSSLEHEEMTMPQSTRLQVRYWFNWWPLSFKLHLGVTGKILSHSCLLAFPQQAFGLVPASCRASETLCFSRTWKAGPGSGLCRGSVPKAPAVRRSPGESQSGDTDHGFGTISCHFNSAFGRVLFYDKMGERGPLLGISSKKTTQNTQECRVCFLKN